MAGSADVATGSEPKTEEFEVSVDLVEGIKVLLDSLTLASSSERPFSSLILCLLSSPNSFLQCFISTLRAFSFSDFSEGDFFYCFN